MWRVFWTAAGCIGVLITFLVWASNQVTFLYVHPRTHGYRVVIDRATGAAVVTTPMTAHGLPVAEGGQPKAVALETEYNFGLMNPLTDGTHHFTVRNEGAAPLRLRVGPTSCKCTVGSLNKGEVLPGESTTVSLQWNTGHQEHYAHGATIYTNDPDHESMEFLVQGNVRMLIGCDQTEISLGSLPPDQPTVVERVIYSQVWNAFTVKDLKKQTAALEWETLPADEELLTRFHATSAQRLRLTLPADIPHGRLTDNLQLSIIPDDGSDVHKLDLPLSGFVPQRVAIYGKAIDAEGIVDLGDVREGNGRRITLLVKVRDPEPELPAAKVEVFPKFLAATFQRRESGKGLYELTIELPADAPQCQYHSSPIGHIKIDSGHPRVGAVELKLSFAVVPRETL